MRRPDLALNPRSIKAFAAAGALALGVSGCSIVENQPSTIKYPAGSQVYFGDKPGEIIIGTTEQTAKAVDCGVEGKRVLGITLPKSIFGMQIGREVSQSEPEPDHNAGKGYVLVTCREQDAEQAKSQPVVVYMKTVTVTEPEKTK